MNVRLMRGDCLQVMATLPEASIDACVTDPPYELGFMGKHWDASGIAYSVEMWREVLRVLKPGAHIVAFGGTRTYHRMAVAIEDAGFEIRDCLQWLYASGFPKSLNVSKAIDAMNGDERPVVGTRQAIPGVAFEQSTPYETGRREISITSAASAAWEGWGTALKPACEPIVLARKPLRGTVASNVLKHGTGALNIDATRISYASDDDKAAAAAAAAAAQRAGHQKAGQGVYEMGFLDGPGSIPGFLDSQDMGRWPANVLIDEDVAEMLDEQSGELTSGANPTRRGTDKFRDIFGAFAGQAECEPARGADFGGASRFYFVAKPSREERDYGCRGLTTKTAGECTDRREGSDGLNNPRAGAGRTGGGRNFHPTVKPVELMRWLVRLVTPINGTVLDPFLGSGTTGMACRYELRSFIGIEREAEYLEIAEKRIAAVAPLFADSSRDGSGNAA